MCARPLALIVCRGIEAGDETCGEHWGEEEEVKVVELGEEELENLDRPSHFLSSTGCGRKR